MGLVACVRPLRVQEREVFPRFVKLPWTPLIRNGAAVTIRAAGRTLPTLTNGILHGPMTPRGALYCGFAPGVAGIAVVSARMTIGGVLMIVSGVFLLLAAKLDVTSAFATSTARSSSIRVTNTLLGVCAVVFMVIGVASILRAR